MTREALRRAIAAFRPGCPQEEADRETMLRWLDTHPAAFTREDEVGHFTASAWIVNPARDQVLMAYHNIYQAWTWLGGHADGETDLLAVALREAQEETGVRAAPVTDAIFSLEILPVPAHEQRGKHVAEHVHLNVTYLLEAPQDAFFRAKPDENSGVKWRDAAEARNDATEACMLPVYRKLTERVRRMKMGKKIGWGVLGTANIGVRDTFAAMAQAENCRMAAIAGRSAEKAADFAARFGFEKAYASYDTLLDDPEVEAVYIPLPNNLHCEWVLRAADKGKHILCEKPMGVSAAEEKKMFDYCRARGVRLMEAFAYLHSPVIREIKRLTDAGGLGELRVVEASFFTRGHYDHPNNIRARRETCGGALYDIGVYNISLAQYLFGREPEKVQATAHFMPSGVDDFSTETLDFGDGRLAALTSGMCSHFARFSNFRVMGDAGWIDAPIEYNACGAQSFTLRRADGTSETVTVDCPNNYTLEIEQFGRVITENEAPLVSEAFSLGVARTVDRALAQIGY